MNREEELLARALNDRADHLDPSLVTLESVRGRAHSIRRRRRRGVALSVAAVALVIAAPLALHVIGKPDAGSIGPAGHAGDKKSADLTEEQGTVSDDLDLSNLPRGADPKVSWIDSSGRRQVVHLASGETITLPDDAPRTVAFAQLGTGVVVVGEGSGVVAYDAQGTEYLREEAQPGLAVDEDRTQVVWTSPVGQARALLAGSDTARDLGDPVPDLALPVRISTFAGDCSGRDTSVPAASPGCTVTFNTGGRGPLWISANGSSGLGEMVVDGRLEESPFSVVTDVMEWGTSGGYTRRVTAGSMSKEACGAVHPQSPSTSATLVTNCDNQPGTFSPDASRVTLGSPPDSSPALPEHVGMATTSDLEPLWLRTRRNDDQAQVSQVVWEDADHLVGVARLPDRSWVLVRFGPDGAATRISDPAPDTGAGRPQPSYVLEVSP